VAFVLIEAGERAVMRDQTAEDDDRTPDYRDRRLKILGQDEIDELYGLPRFSDEERELYFSLTPSGEVALDDLHSTKSKIAFILQLGYFKARCLFFVFTADEVTADLHHVAARYFPDTAGPDCTVSKRTRLKHQRLILELCNYKLCNDSDRRHLEAKTREAAMVSGKPIYVFRQLLLELQARHLTIPGYSFLQDTVGRAPTFEQTRLSDILKEQLTPSDRQTLNALLEDQSGLYHITLLKRDPRDFSATEIKREIARGAQIRDLYLRSQQVLPALKISNESIKYCASLVGYYSVFRLNWFEPWTVYIYLLCFIHHRYRQHSDNLLASFIFHVREFADDARAAAKERVYQHRVEVSRNLLKAAQVLKLFTTEEITGDAPFHEVQARAFAILEREKLDDVAEHITGQLRRNRISMGAHRQAGLSVQAASATCLVGVCSGYV
jgi:hypothetical protein